MGPLWQAVIWSAIPVALFLLVTAVGVYAFSHRQPRRHEDPVEIAYLEARACAGGAASERGGGMSRHLAGRSR